MSPPVDTSSFQLGVPPDYDDPAEAEEEAQWMRDLADRALDYMTSFEWAPPIRDVMLAFGVGEVIGLFLVRFARPVPGGEEDDTEVWIVVGDLPTIFFAAEPRTPADALRLYCVIAEDWAEKVLAGADLSDAFPISVTPTRELAEMLMSRLGFVREKFIPLAGAADRISKQPLEFASSWPGRARP